jgi:Na+-driven multidrug efflux pump
MSGYWIVGIPLSCLFVFKYDMSLNGLWIGPTFACAYITACMAYLVLRIDWDSLVASINERNEKERQLKEALMRQQ